MLAMSHAVSHGMNPFVGTNHDLESPMPMRSRLIEGEFTPGDLFREAAALVALSAPFPAPETKQQVLSGQFKGWMWMDEVHPGLNGSACDMVTLSDAVITQPIERSVLITMLLRGGNGVLMPEPGEAIVCLPERPQIVGLGEERRYARSLTAGQQCVRVGVMVRPTFVEQRADALSGDDLDLLDQLMSRGFRSLTLPRCEVMVQLSKALVESSYCGSLGSLFRESAITQMMFQALRLLRTEERRFRRLGKRHHDAVVEARTLLDAALLSPPGTIELARQVGLNRNALQAGFKAMFGTTIFGYVREQRLTMARVLIEEHGLGAAEAGYKVGFASPSAFSAAYRRQFGHSPTAGLPGTRHKA